MDRPKRRYKDNPYSLLYEKDKDKYYILFKDSNNVINKVEVSLVIYDVFNCSELHDLKEMNEYDNHIEHNDLYEESMYKRINHKDELVDDYVIRKSTYEDLTIAINKQPEIQRRRIKNYYFDEKNEYEIAKEESTSHQAIHQSLYIAIKNPKKY